jgi:hypothetical protein
MFWFGEVFPEIIHPVCRCARGKIEFCTVACGNENALVRVPVPERRKEVFDFLDREPEPLPDINGCGTVIYSETDNVHAMIPALDP